MDSEEIVQQAVDEIFKRIREDSDADKDLKAWIAAFAQKNIDEDKQWNPSALVKRFSTELLKERLMQRMDDIQDAFSNKNLIQEYKLQLEQLCQQTEQQVCDLLLQAISVFSSEEGWNKNIISAFKKSPIEWLTGKIGATFYKVLENPSSVYIKSIIPEYIL